MRHQFLACAALALLALPVFSADVPRTITVNGRGTAAAPPDMATVRAGVTTSAKTAAEAVTANNRAMQDVIKLLKDRRIEPKDIQTSGFSIYPEYAPRHQNLRDGPSHPPTVIAYRVSNNVSVRVRHLPALGEILDALVRAGSNQISGVTLGIADQRAVENEARRDAVKDARRRAALYAEATGVKVGPVLSISEQPIQVPRPAFQPRMAMMEAASSVPIEGGEQEISASINVVYELMD